MFGRRQKAPAYDTAGKVPTIRASICTGEKAAGFTDPKTGKFDELALIRTDADLADFCRMYGVEKDDIRREW